MVQGTSDETPIGYSPATFGVKCRCFLAWILLTKDSKQLTTSEQGEDHCSQLKDIRHVRTCTGKPMQCHEAQCEPRDWDLSAVVIDLYQLSVSKCVCDARMEWRTKVVDPHCC